MNISSTSINSTGAALQGGNSVGNQAEVDFESIFESMATADADSESAQCGSYAGCRKTSCGTSSFINW